MFADTKQADATGSAAGANRRPVMNSPGHELRRVPKGMLLGAIQLEVQHIAVEEWQGVERLVLRGSRDIGLPGQVRMKSLNLQRANFGTVAPVVKNNVALCPMEIRFFGGSRTVLDAASIAELVEKFVRLG